MNRIIFFLIATALFGGNLAAQTVIAAWNFNQGTMVATTGAGVLTNTGSISANYVSGTGSTDPAINNLALSTAGYPAVNSGDRAHGLKLHFNTIGFYGIQLHFDSRNSATAANKLVVQYATDDINYTDAPGNGFIAMNTSFNHWTADLSSLTVISNAPDLYLKIVTAFSGTQYQPTLPGNYNSSGTIRFDMITVTGISNSCVGNATLQATGMQLLITDTASMTIAINRGNGHGCIVTCRLSATPESFPLSGLEYNANPMFGAGSTTGAGNFVIFSSRSKGAQRFTVAGLTAGVAYSFAAYEYSEGGFCYLTPPANFTGTCNSTVLKTGDMLITGFDAHTGAGGVDRYQLSNLTDLKKGTSFSLVNSRFEAGAPASTRTLHWRGPGTSPFADPNVLTFTYIGNSPLSAGSVFCFDLNGDASNLTINGTAAAALFETPVDNLSLSGGFLSTTAPDQIFLVSGYFTPYGMDGLDKYNLLTGNILCAISNGSNWVPFSNPVSTAVRESRVPPELLCINLFLHGIVNGYAYLKPSTLHTGTKKQILENFASADNWQYGLGNDQVNDIAPAANSLFTLLPAASDGSWTGAANSDWFNCSNWQGLTVPGITSEVTIDGPPSVPLINTASSSFAPEFENVARTGSLYIGSRSVLSIQGPASDRLRAYGEVHISGNGSLRFDSASASVNDTFFIKNNLETGTAAGTGLILERASLVLEDNSANKKSEFSFNGIQPFTCSKFLLNCNSGLALTGNQGMEVRDLLTLQTGILSTLANSIKLSPLCTISSPVNDYGETDNGWAGSFVNGTLTRGSNQAQITKFPLGSVAGNRIFYAPVAITPANAILKNYTARYIPTAHPDIFNVSNLDHVSQLEYWELACSAAINPDKDARITLYWNSRSQVSPGPLSDLRIAHYFDDDGAPGINNHWTIDANPGSFLTTGNLQFGTITNLLFTTSFSPFTLATVGPGNVLPATIKEWKGWLQADHIQLSWQTLNEIPGCRYLIERSTDSLRFSNLLTLPGGNAVGNEKHQGVDARPGAGFNYYRLRVMAADGTALLSPVIRIWYPKNVLPRYHPNPVSGTMYLEFSEIETSILLTDITGKICLQMNTDNRRNIEMNTAALAPGIYILHYRSLHAASAFRVVIK